LARSSKRKSPRGVLPALFECLVNACNQKNNRDPVMELSEGAVRQALDTLSEKGLAARPGAPTRALVKFEHRLQEAFNFNGARPRSVV